MRDKLLVIIAFLLAFSCSEEDLPRGIYHYQVERLLSGETGSKVWSQVVNSTNCQDSTKLYFELIDDSLDISQINPEPNCTFSDTLYLGRSNASKFSDRNIFTDSLIFSNGDFWLVENITADLLSILREGDVSDYASQH